MVGTAPRALCDFPLLTFKCSAPYIASLSVCVMATSREGLVGSDTILLIAGDGTTFPLSRKAAQRSDVLRQFIAYSAAETNAEGNTTALLPPTSAPKRQVQPSGPHRSHHDSGIRGTANQRSSRPVSRGDGALEFPVVSELRPLSGQAISLCVEYMVHHADGPEPTTLPRPIPDPDSFGSLLSVWEYNFVYTKLLENGDVWRHRLLVEVMYVAQHLLIQPLRDLCAAWCGAQIAIFCSKIHHFDEAAEHIRKFFSIANDWTEKDMEMLCLENDWPEGED